MNLLRVFKNAGWGLTDRIIRLLGGFFVGVWVAKSLNADGFGLLSTASAITLMFSPFATLGLDGILIRDLARAPDRAPTLLPSALAMRLVGGLFAWGCGWCVVYWTQPTSGGVEAVYWIMLFGNLASFGDVFDAYFQSRAQLAIPTLVKITAFVLANGVRLIAVANRWSLPLIAGTFVLEPLIVSCLLSAAGLMRGPAWATSPSWRSVRYLFGEASPLAAALLCYLGYSRLDQLIVMSALGAHDAGIYAVSTRLLEIPLLGGMAVASALYPFLAKQGAERPGAGAHDSYEPWVAGASLLGWLWLALWLLCGEPLVAWLFGPDYQGAGQVTALRSIGLLFLLNGFLRSTYMTNTGQQKILLYTSLMGAVLSFSMNYAGAAYGGLTGVAITYSISQCLVLFLVNFAFDSMREFGVMQWRGLLLCTVFFPRPTVRDEGRCP